MIDKTQLLTAFVRAKSFHLGKGMHSYVSSQDLAASYNGLRDSKEISSFMEFLCSIGVAEQVDKMSLRREYVQIPEYRILTDRFYSDYSLIQKYVLGGSNCSH